jgi:hypothetical protein
MMYYGKTIFGVVFGIYLTIIVTIIISVFVPERSRVHPRSASPFTFTFLSPRDPFCFFLGKEENSSSKRSGRHIFVDRGQRQERGGKGGRSLLPREVTTLKRKRNKHPKRV